MTIVAIAKRTVGFGCIKGDVAKYESVQCIEDAGTYYNVVIHSNRSIRLDKKNWQLIIAE